ncbi:hypothetical protein [Rufibacter roseus]|uniref:Uncharacterized protein n=1 Tax=Rufibacter roseus TaxID=1567108 RepID=A0ABW2DQ14_9BACT|nr:hypothetical protein [Rufibacter roseus]
MLIKLSSRPLLNSTTVFTLTLLVLGMTVLGVYLFGLGRHHTFFQNSLLSTTLLSVVFFAFVCSGLYRGVKLRDTLGRVTDKIPFRRKNKNSGQSSSNLIDVSGLLPSFSKSSSTDSGGGGSSFDFGDFGDGEGFVAVIVGVLAWVAAAVVLSVVLFLFGEVLLVAIFAFIAMLYWIFFRALRLVFRHSHQTKGKFFSSIGYGLLYTVLYNSWIYAIFLLVEYWRG